MPEQPDEKGALQILRLAVEFMQWKTFEGGRRDRHEAALPLKKDGMYHYDDGKIDVAYDVNTRSHRTDTYVRVSIIRGSLLRKRELVLDAENNCIKVFRPGHWINHVAYLAESAENERRACEEAEKRVREEAGSRAEEQSRKNFIPVDDSVVFRK